MTHTDDPISIDRQGDVATVRLCRPDKHNALNWALMDGLIRTAKSLRRDRTLRAVILHGEGPSFCSGLDFPQVTRTPARILRAFVSGGASGTNRFQEVCQVWRRLPVPVIAVLHGHCYGGGLQLALAADFRLATPDCELSVLEARWGLIPDMSGSVTLRELLPIDQAKRLAMTGAMIDGREALSLNLVTEVADDPMAAAEALAASLQERSPDSVAATKALFQRTWVAGAADAFRTERRLQARILLGKNQRIALRAAFDKAVPRFRARQSGFGG
jgi:enoyl-CoA hydratase/carnithine racemase